MKRSPSGFTLMEVIIASALAGTAMIMAVRMVGGYFSAFSSNSEVLEREAELTVFEMDMRRYFERTVDLALTRQGPPVPGFAIRGNGAVVMVADMRPCNTFNPNNSGPATRSQIRIICCGAGMSMNANRPFGGTVPVNSQCRNVPGLSLQVLQGGNVVRSHCYRGVTEFDVATAGFDRINQSTLYFFNVGTPSGLATGENDAIAESRARLQMYLSPGFNGNQHAVSCQEPVGFGV